MEIENTSQKFVQLNIMNFFEICEAPKPNDFEPIDVKRPPKKVIQRKRGRPRKYPIPIEESKQNVETLNQRQTEEILSEDEPEETKLDSTEGNKGPYNKITFQKKLSILNQYDDFKKCPLLNGRPLSFSEFCHRVGDSL